MEAGPIGRLIDLRLLPGPLTHDTLFELISGFRTLPGRAESRPGNGAAGTRCIPGEDVGGQPRGGEASMSGPGWVGLMATDVASSEV